MRNPSTMRGAGPVSAVLLGTDSSRTGRPEDPLMVSKCPMEELHMASSPMEELLTLNSPMAVRIPARATGRVYSLDKYQVTMVALSCE